MLSSGKAQVFLSAGLLSGTVAMALVQFVIIGLIGLLIAPFAFAALIIAGVRARDRTVSKHRAMQGLLVFLAGVVILTYSAGLWSSYGFSIAFHRDHPTGMLPSVLDWIIPILSGVIAALAIAIGLVLRARWTIGQAAFWSSAAFFVLPVGLALFLMLSHVLPIGT